MKVIRATISKDNKRICTEELNEKFDGVHIDEFRAEFKIKRGLSDAHQVDLMYAKKVDVKGD